MPFRSEAQRRWMFANEPEMAHRWAEHTPEGKLPPRVGKKHKVDWLRRGRNKAKR